MGIIANYYMQADTKLISHLPQLFYVYIFECISC